MKAKSRKSKKIPYGPNIVRAWFDTVLKFALQGLENERSFLESRNWTFRFQSDALEYLGPFREHVPGDAMPNLEQFVSFFPEVEAKISNHDDWENQLEEDCRAYFRAVLKAKDFRTILESMESKEQSSLNADFSNCLGAFHQRDDFMATLAEYIVNNLERLPSYYRTAEFWNRYSDQFLAVRDDLTVKLFRDKVELSGNRLLVAVDELVCIIKDKRSELSLEYDVPFVVELNNAR